MSAIRADHAAAVSMLREEHDGVIVKLGEETKAEVKAKARREQQMEKERVERYRQFKGAPPVTPPRSAARCMHAALGGGRLGGGGTGSWAGPVPGSESEGGCSPSSGLSEEASV